MQLVNDSSSKIQAHWISCEHEHKTKHPAHLQPQTLFMVSADPIKATVAQAVDIELMYLPPGSWGPGYG